MSIALACKRITDLDADSADVARRRYGVIETSAGRFVSLTLRPLPKLLSLRELWPVGDRYHARGPADRCRLYYNQPRSADGYLALKYIVTTAETSYRTVLAAIKALDQVAQIKQSEAIVCDAANLRLTDRVLARHGYVPHAPMPWRRSFIRRFERDESSDRIEEFRQRLLAETG